MGTQKKNADANSSIFPVGGKEGKLEIDIYCTSSPIKCWLMLA